MGGRILPRFQSTVKAILEKSDELRAFPEQHLQILLSDVRAKWRGRIEDRWKAHQQAAARGECAIDDWDPAAEMFSNNEIITICALVREVSSRRLHLRHFDVQVAAGLALLDGSFIQMKTGEGKTIVALFPAVVFGLITKLDWDVVHGSNPARPRRSVHLITANAYLAQRDAMELQSTYAFFGLTVGVLPSGYEPLEKLIAYNCDVLYSTVSQLGFDYLSDHVVTRAGAKRQGLLYFAILDEVDHILVDEGTTPLVLSSDDLEFAEQQRRTVLLFDHLVRRLYEAPQVFTRVEEVGLQLTELGAEALSQLLDHFLEQPSPLEKWGAPGMAAALLGQLCLQAMDWVEGENTSFRDLLIEHDKDGEIRLTAEAHELLQDLVAQWSSAAEMSIGDLVGTFFKMLNSLMRARFVAAQLAQLTKEDLRVLKRLLVSKVNVLRRVDESVLAREIGHFLERFVAELMAVLRKEGVAEYSKNLRLLLYAAQRAGLSSSRHRAWRLLAAALLRVGVSQKPTSEEVARFGHDLQRFWIAPISRSVLAWLEGRPPEERRAILVLLRYLGAIFASGHLNPSASRQLSAMRSYVKDFLFYPSFYTVWGLEEHIQLNELCRVLLRNFVSEALRFDLWPDKKVEDGETHAEAVRRLLPEAEALLRRGLHAYIFCRRDVHYIVHQDHVVLISQYTGFLEPNRRYGDVQHLFLEQKEGVRVRQQRKTVGRISIQRFVLLYRRLAGMSATAVFSEQEFRKIYGVKVIEIPPNRGELEVLAIGVKKEPLQGEALVYLTGQSDIGRALDVINDHLLRGRPISAFAKEPEWIEKLERQLRQERPGLAARRLRMPNLRRMDDLVYMTEREKLEAAADLVHDHSRRGQPILVGAPSIEVAEKFAQVLSRRYPEMRFVALDARPEHAREAEIIARAGEIGRVTVATQMAGRGVDIVLRPEAVERGGLLVVGIERRDSSRWDEQIVGRCARQGDLGCGVFFSSLEDELMQVLGSSRIQGLMENLGMEEGEAIQHGMVTRAIRRSQAMLEERNYLQRASTLRKDEELSQIRNELYNLRHATLAASHPCRGWGHGHYVASLEVAEPHWVCRTCRDQDDRIEERPTIFLLREEFQWILATGIDDCLSPVRLESYLVDAYSDEHIPVESWDWEGLLRDLSEYLGRGVARNEICRVSGLADRMIRIRNRRKYVPRVIYGWLEARQDPQAAQYVNASPGSYPWVEREALRRRLGSLLETDRLENMIRDILRRSLRDRAFQADQVYWGLMELPLGPVPESVLGSFGEFRARVKNEEMLRPYLRKRLGDQWLLETVRHSASEDQAAAKLSLFLRPFAVPRQEIENRLAGETGANVRRWAMEKILETYHAAIRRHGKAQVYWQENQALREAIDKHFHPFLDNYEVYASASGRHRDIEDSEREIRLKVRTVWEQMRSAIARTFLSKLAEQLRSREATVETGAPHSFGPLLADLRGLCGCRSGLVFEACCGSHLHEAVR